MEEQTITTNPPEQSASENASVQKIAQNPNPRANGNSTHTLYEEKEQATPGNDAGTKITDGEAG